MDISLCDKFGNICVKIVGFSTRFANSGFSISAAIADENTQDTGAFDDAFYEELMVKIKKNEISADEAVELG